MSTTQKAENPIEKRRQRIQRTEELLDRWLDLFDNLLERADRALAESDAAPKLPDLSRLTDLTSAITITKRACEIELIVQRLDDSHQSKESFVLDPQLLLGAICRDDPDE